MGPFLWLYGGCVNTLIFPKLMICGMDHCYARAATCDFEHCGILTSVDSDQPVQPPVKLRNSKLCSVSSFTLIEYSSGLWIASDIWLVPFNSRASVVTEFIV